MLTGFTKPRENANNGAQAAKSLKRVIICVKAVLPKLLTQVLQVLQRLRSILKVESLQAAIALIPPSDRLCG